jgi:hypothetical protein
MTKEWKGWSVLEGASLVRVGSIRDPSIVFFELYNKGIARTNDITDQFVAWLDDVPRCD